MALIFADGYTGAESLATLFAQQEKARANVEALRNRPDVTSAQRNAALGEREDAQFAYENAVAIAEVAIKSQPGDRAHAIVIGVGRYNDPSIPTVTTSVRGAWAFTEWLLTEYTHPNRPLGSVELLLSATNDPGDYMPSPSAALRIGVATGSTLPGEAATFGNIQVAYTRWLERARQHSQNAALFYFSGHGLWKNKPYPLPEDAQIASNTQPFARLINIADTVIDQATYQPGLQCYFVDACQTLPTQLLENTTAEPGTVLNQPNNGAWVERDVHLYYGSRPGRAAYGPADAPPFFTQELLECLRKRGAQTNPIGGKWIVSTASLREALGAAANRRSVQEKVKLQFLDKSENVGLSNELCHLSEMPEVFVRLFCYPPHTFADAHLFVEPTGAPRTERAPSAPNEWYTLVPYGPCLAGATFAPPPAWSCPTANFTPTPPMMPVLLTLDPVVAAGDGGTQ